MGITGLWRKIIPQEFRQYIRGIRLYPQIMFKYKGKSEYAQELEYVQKNKVKFKKGEVRGIEFCGDFMDEAMKQDTPAYFDTDKQMYYVIDQGKRLYFKKGLSESQVKNGYRGLLGEQCEKSPHKYVDDDFFVEQDSVLFDIGAAEAIFALQNIEKCKKVVLFECDDSWIEALNATFEPYMEKVEIVRKYVSNITDADNIKIDDYTQASGNIPNFIKMDIEGFEQKCLDGMEKTLHGTASLKLAICAYHSKNAEMEIRNKLSAVNCGITRSGGWMLWTME
ncbi:MAG: hypothetical protein RSE24_04065, partial [Oscillospiraceae bacterium]